MIARHELRNFARELRATLRDHASDGLPLMARVVPLFAGGIGAEVAAYRPELVHGGWRCESLELSHHPRMRALADNSAAFLRDAPLSFAHFDALRVQAAQQNVLMDQATMRKVWSENMPLLAQRVHRPLGLCSVPQMRVTLTDGPFLLSWLGMWREEPFTPAEEELVRAAIPALAGRLRAERLLGREVPAPFHALADALELVSLPAFLLTPRGALAIANTAGRAMLEEDRSILDECVMAARSGRSTARVNMVTRVTGLGVGRHTIVTATLPDVAIRLGRVHRAKKLTAAELRVLEHVVRGDANKDVAGKLGCAPRTVGVHVASLMRKCGADSRARLVAWFWTKSI